MSANVAVTGRAIRVLLVHPGAIPHYRISIYNYLSEYLRRHGFELYVACDEVHPGFAGEIAFDHDATRLSTSSIVKIVRSRRIKIVVDFMQLRNLYLFPTYLVSKCAFGTKFVYWGQGRDLADTTSVAKNLAYTTEQFLSDAIILYAEHLKRHLPKAFHKKTFVANNTLCVEYSGMAAGKTKESVLKRYGIRTPKNIVCCGRMQKRKRIENLVSAWSLMNRDDVGLILIGPDDEGVLRNFVDPDIHILGPLYGDEKFDLLVSSDVYCLPGAVGLSVVDAFHAGLPFVTEVGDESAETMYLQDGVNGFTVPRGNAAAMAAKLTLLIDDDELRRRFSDAARRMIAEKGSMEEFCAGFKDALCYAAS